MLQISFFDKWSIFFLFFLGQTMTTHAQPSPVRNTLSIKATDLINLGLHVDYQLQLNKKQLSLYFSTGIQYHHNLPKTIGINQKLTNFYTAKVTGSALSFTQHNEVIGSIFQKDVIEYYHNTTSYAIYNTIKPKVSIPLGIGYRNTFNQKSKIKFFYSLHSYLITHLGQVLDTKTIIRNDVTPPSTISEGYRIVNFKEQIESKSGLKFTYSVSFNLGFRFDVFKDYFLELIPEYGFYTGTLEPTIQYHGIHQHTMARLVISVGEYL